MSYLNEENQKKFDHLFSNFIGDFGTHYFSHAKMGAVMRIREEMTNLEKTDAKDKNFMVGAINYKLFKMFKCSSFNILGYLNNYQYVRTF